MEEWYSEFSFRSVGCEEEKALRGYFASERWERGLELTKNRELTTHVHINIRTSLPPQAFEKFGRKDLCKRGWQVDWSYPTVYTAHGALKKVQTSGPMAGYFNKVVFFALKPVEGPVDLAWTFDPGVIIEGDPTPRLRTDLPGYDAFLKKELEDMHKAHSWVILKKKEVETILEALRHRHSARVWEWPE